MIISPSHRKVINHIRPVFEKILIDDNNDDKNNEIHNEFEGRIGRIEEIEGRKIFVGGVSKEAFSTVFSRLSGSEMFIKEGPVDTGDYCFKNNIRGSFNNENPQHPSFLQKFLVRNINVGCVNNDGAETKHIIRLSEKKEIPIPLEGGKDIGTYSFVRIKRRWKFIYKMWSYDLTAIWEGKNPAEARFNDAEEEKEPDIYEIEIEYINEKGKNCDPEYLSLSLLDKMGDIIKTIENFDNINYVFLSERKTK